MLTYVKYVSIAGAIQEYLVHNAGVLICQIPQFTIVVGDCLRASGGNEQVIRNSVSSLSLRTLSMGRAPEAANVSGQLLIVLSFGPLPILLRFLLHLSHLRFHTLPLRSVVRSHPLHGLLDLPDLFLQTPLHFLQLPPRLLVLFLQCSHHLPLKLVHLGLMFHDQFLEFLVDRFSGCRLDDVLAFFHQLPLDLQCNRVVVHDLPKNIMSGFGSVVMSGQLRTLIEGWLEKFAGELLLASLVDVQRVRLPHICDENDVLQRRFTTELAEHVEVPTGDPTETVVGDPVDVDDPGEFRSLLVSDGKFSLQD